MNGVTVEIPAELANLLGSEAEVKREAQVALVLDLVRLGKISRAKAAELLKMPLSDLPKLLTRYRILWFDYSVEDMERDLRALRAPEGRAG